MLGFQSFQLHGPSLVMWHELLLHELILRRLASYAAVHDGSVTSSTSMRPDSPGPLPMSPVSLGISAPSLLRRHSWRGKAAAVGAASQLAADHAIPEEAVRSNSIERHRRLHGDCYQGFSEEQEEEGERSLRLELGVGERLAQVPEVDAPLLPGDMLVMPASASVAVQRNLFKYPIYAYLNDFFCPTLTGGV